MQATDRNRTLRRRIDVVEQAQDLERIKVGSGRVLVEVINGGHIPSTVPNQFMVLPVRISDQIEEGLAPTLTSGEAPFICTVLGPKIPGVGDKLVAHQIGGRWVSGNSGGCGTMCIRVEAASPYAPGTPVSCVPVSVSDIHGDPVGNCTTNADGECCITITSPGTYTVNYPGGTATQILDCGPSVTTTVQITPPGSAGGTLCRVAGGHFCCPTPETPITFTFTGALNCTVMQTSCAAVPIYSAAGMVSWTATAPNHIPHSGTGISAGAPLAPNDPPPSSYCFPSIPCFSAVPAQLMLTASNDIAFWGDPATGGIAGTTVTVPLVFSDSGSASYQTTYRNPGVLTLFIGLFLTCGTDGSISYGISVSAESGIQPFTMDPGESICPVMASGTATFAPLATAVISE